MGISLTTLLNQANQLAKQSAQLAQLSRPAASPTTPLTAPAAAPAASQDSKSISSATGALVSLADQNFSSTALFGTDQTNAQKAGGDLDANLSKFVASFKALPPAAQQSLLANPAFAIKVTGHASNAGSAKGFDNKALSAARADSTAKYVAAFLAKNGIQMPAGRIQTVAAGDPGSTKPADNNDASDRSATVAFEIPKPGAASATSKAGGTSTFLASQISSAEATITKNYEASAASFVSQGGSAQDLKAATANVKLSLSMLEQAKAAVQKLSLTPTQQSQLSMAVARLSSAKTFELDPAAFATTLASILTSPGGVPVASAASSSATATAASTDTATAASTDTTASTSTAAAAGHKADLDTMKLILDNWDAVSQKGSTITLDKVKKQMATTVSGLNQFEADFKAMAPSGEMTKAQLQKIYDSLGGQSTSAAAASSTPASASTSPASTSSTAAASSTDATANTASVDGYNVSGSIDDQKKLLQLILDNWKGTSGGQSDISQATLEKNLAYGLSGSKELWTYLKAHPGASLSQSDVKGMMAKLDAGTSLADQ